MTYGVVPIPPLQRAAARLVPGPNGCWLWTGGTVPGGYGQIELTPGPGRQRSTTVVHRLVFEAFFGTIPLDHDVHHVCGVRLCANPFHLALLDHRRHAVLHMPRSATCRRCGTADWHERRDGRRTCRECRRRRRRARTAERTAP